MKNPLSVLLRRGDFVYSHFQFVDREFVTL
jgi:hypothetical protein